MPERVIHPKTGHPAHLAFVRANGLEPGDIALEPLTVTDDRLAFTAFVRDGDGRKRLNQESDGFLREQRSVPLVAPPEAFGI